MTNLLRAPALWRARTVTRDWTNAHLNRPVARALKVAAALRRGADVLYFGDSSLVFTSPHDQDRRRLGEMLADEAGVRVAQYYGPAYSAPLHAELARLIAPLPRPGCVVVSMPIRPTLRHVTAHPMFSYAGALAALRAATGIDQHLLRALYKRSATDAEYAAFEAITRPTRWQLGRSFGDYRRRLRGYDPAGADEDRQRLLFDYFHGEFGADTDGADRWRAFGRYLRELQVPVFFYRTYMPMQRGAALFGDSFTTHVEENFALIEEGFLQGLDGGGGRVPVGVIPDELFIAATDGTEHYNERGRHHVIAALRPLVQAHVARR
ncbi:MAG: hypothetical protein EPN43_06645 [Jatrophihabitans sp.]|nr:MAG: hypothetical protein EPN43_06645 [Jatrophihabitans sp.]